MSQTQCQHMKFYKPDMDEAFLSSSLPFGTHYDTEESFMLVQENTIIKFMNPASVLGLMALESRNCMPLTS